MKSVGRLVRWLRDWIETLRALCDPLSRETLCGRSSEDDYVEVERPGASQDPSKRSLALDVSSCCGAALTLGLGGIKEFPGVAEGQGEVATVYYICTECMKPCDAVRR